MLEALDQTIPGVNSSNTLLYAVEMKYYSSKIGDKSRSSIKKKRKKELK